MFIHLLEEFIVAVMSGRLWGENTFKIFDRGRLVVLEKMDYTDLMNFFGMVGIKGNDILARNPHVVDLSRYWFIPEGKFEGEIIGSIRVDNLFGLV